MLVLCLLFLLFFFGDSFLVLLGFFFRKFGPSSCTGTAYECSITASMAVLWIRGSSSSVMAEVLLTLVCSDSTSSDESSISAVMVASPSYWWGLIIPCRLCTRYGAVTSYRVLR